MRRTRHRSRRLSMRRGAVNTDCRSHIVGIGCCRHHPRRLDPSSMCSGVTGARSSRVYRRGGGDRYRARPLPRLRGRPFPDRSGRPEFEDRLAECRGGRDPFFPCPAKLNCASSTSTRLPLTCPWGLPPCRRARRGPPSRLPFSRTVKTGADRVGGGAPSRRSRVARISGRLTESTGGGGAASTVGA
jgi:hypothetical protein